jgi:hypothetical protein
MLSAGDRLLDAFRNSRAREPVSGPALPSNRVVPSAGDRLLDAFRNSRAR